MMESNYSKIVARNASTLASNPFAQRIDPVSDIATHINKAQNATDIASKLEIYEHIIKNMPVNLELSRCYTVLLADIFGLGDLPGWRLHTLSKQSHRDGALFQVVNDFMMPNGNLFKLIEKLEYQNATYEFPPIMLPTHSQSPIQQTYPSLVAAKGPHHILSGSHIALSQSLSALRYFLILFFGYILQPKMQKEQIDWNGDALYVCLFEAYLRHFLPKEEQKKIDLDSQAHSSSGTLFHQHEKSSGLISANSTGSYSSSQSFNYNGIYSRDSMSIMFNNGVRDSFPSSRQWEAFIEVLRDVWFGYESLEAQDYFLPGVDQVLLTRIFIKHLHLFLYNTTSSNSKEVPPSSKSTSQNDELERMILPMLQENLFIFFKNCFLHWPLDASFKVVCETWLSYIQPWRYRNLNDQESLENLNDWAGFIKNNLVFYAVIFRMFMQRAARLDLQLLRDVQFIFRVTKVFSNLNLCELLRKAEDAVLMPSSQASLHTLAYAQPGSHYVQLYASARNAVLEVAPYESMFDHGFVHQMEDLARILFNKAEAIQSERAAQRSTGKVDNSFLGCILAFLRQRSDADESAGDTDLEEKLMKTSSQLAAIFNFAIPVSATPTVEQTGFNEEWQLPKPFVSDKSYDDGRLLPEHIIESDGTVTLTEKGRLQMLNKLRHFDIQGKAGTELEPVKSYEIPTLVRMLHDLSTKLNRKYHAQLKTLYNKDGVVGKVFRTLSPKVKEHCGISVKLPSSQKIGVVEPRLCLRFLASYYSIYYILWLIFLFRLFDLGTLGCIVFLILLFVFFTLQNVVSAPLKSINE